MPTPRATAFRPGRRSHRGRLGRRSDRSRARVDFAGRCSTSWETASSSSASAVSAARRSRTRRARAASARASALATSSSASASEMGASAPESTPERDCGSSGYVFHVPPGHARRISLSSSAGGSPLSSDGCLLFLLTCADTGRQATTWGGARVDPGSTARWLR